MPSDIVLSVENLAKKFGTLEVLKSIHLTVHRGEVVVRARPSPGPVEQLRRDRVVPRRREPARHVADVLVEPERLLDHDHRRGQRIG